MALNDKKFNQDLFTRIFDVWARKTPSYEKHYEHLAKEPMRLLMRKVRFLELDMNR